MAIAFDRYEMQKKKTAKFCSLWRQLPSSVESTKAKKSNFLLLLRLLLMLFLLLLIMRNNSNKKRVQFEPKEVAHAPHVQHWGAERCVRRMQRQLLCLTFARDRRGEGSGTWLIAVAQFTTATHCDCCRLGHDS